MATLYYVGTTKDGKGRMAYTVKGPSEVMATVQISGMNLERVSRWQYIRFRFDTWRIWWGLK